MNGVSEVVFSTTLDRADWNNSRLVRGKAEDEVAALKGQPGKDLHILEARPLATGCVILRYKPAG